VAGVREHVKLGWDAGVPASVGPAKAVPHGHRVVRGTVDEESRRCFLADVQDRRAGVDFRLWRRRRKEHVRRVIVGGWIRQGNDRVDQTQKRRASRELVSGIYRFVKRLVVGDGEVRGQMPAGREADHAKTIGVDLELGGACADQAHCALRVLDRDQAAIGPAFAREPIGEDEDGRPLGIVALGNVEAFILDREELVAAARERQQRRAVGPGRAKDVDLGEGHAAHPQLAVGRRDVHRPVGDDLRLGCSWRAAGPQWEALLRRPVGRRRIAGERRWRQILCLGCGGREQRDAAAEEGSPFDLHACSPVPVTAGRPCRPL